MINILLVEDNNIKIKEVKKILLSVPDILEQNIDSANDIVNAQKKISENQYDLMILDLSLPVRFGDDPDKEGGLNFLREIIADETYILPFHIIGLTAYDDLKLKNENFFKEFMWQLLYYSEQQAAWKSHLTNFIKYLIRSKSELLNPTNIKFGYDLAIVTALHKVELENVLKLDANWEKHSITNEPSIFHKGIFKNDKKTVRVVAASAEQMGLTSMSAICHKVIQYFKPRYIIISGIAAGIKGKADFGDILIADLTWDYSSGKISTGKNGYYKFLQDPRPIFLSPEIKSKIQIDQLQNAYLPIIEEKWKQGNGEQFNHRLKMVIGPIASGSYVIENIKKVQEVIDQQRKLIGIDMETYAVFYTANHCSDPKPIALSIKSVCDYGDGDKNDKYQNYAAFTSANYIYAFALAHI